MRLFFKDFFLICLAALLAGLSQATVFEGWVLPNLGFLAFFAYVPLFYILLNENRVKYLFYKSFLFGIVYNLFVVYWLFIALHRFGSLSVFVSIILLFLLALLLGAYFALIFLLSGFLSKKTDLSITWILPGVWILIEWARNFFPFNGFPWGQIGYSQAFYPTVIQIADLFGIYGVTGVIVISNLLLVSVLFLRKKTSIFFKNSLIFNIVVLIILCFTFIYGILEKKHWDAFLKELPKKTVAVVQGNIQQDEKWTDDEDLKQRILDRYANLTREAFQAGAEIVIWPEASSPYYLPLDRPDILELLGDYAGEVLIGSMTFHANGRSLQEIDLNTLLAYNSLFVWQPKNEDFNNNSNDLNKFSRLNSIYHKRHLVPFGEYIPFEKWIPGLSKFALASGIGGVLEGENWNPLKLKSFLVGALICYEDVFPEVARAQVSNGADLLVNVSNDAWYGNSSALPQHLAFSVFRAVENRRFLARATNTGLSAFIAPTGEWIARLPVYKQGVLTAKVAPIKTISFYTRFPNLLIGFLFVFLFGLITTSWLKKRRTLND